MPQKAQLNIYLSPKDWAQLEAVRRLRGGRSLTSYVRDDVLRAIQREVSQEDPTEIDALTRRLLKEEFGIDS